VLLCLRQNLLSQPIRRLETEYVLELLNGNSRPSRTSLQNSEVQKNWNASWRNLQGLRQVSPRGVPTASIDEKGRQIRVRLEIVGFEFKRTFVVPCCQVGIVRLHENGRSYKVGCDNSA